MLSVPGFLPPSLFSSETIIATIAKEKGLDKMNLYFNLL